MGDPITIALGVASALGSVVQGIQAKKAADFQAAVARNNAIIAERAAVDAQARGEVRAAEAAQASRRLLARQRTAQAAAGQQVDVGSALDLNIEEAEAGTLDQLTIRSNAEREALGFRTQGMNFQSQATLNRLQGQGALTSALFSAGTTAFDTGSSLLTGAKRTAIPRRTSPRGRGRI